MPLESERLSNSSALEVAAGWLAKYLAKTGPGSIFDGSDVEHRQRVK